jgi:ligand-binding sensor domain-containing protein/signal transduction histidine kinase
MYDGARFTNYFTVNGLSNNWITSIAEDPGEPGTLWVGTIAGGVNRLKRGHIVSFRPGTDNPSNSIEAITIDTSGTAWAIATHGVYRIHNDSLEEFTPPFNDEVDWLLSSQDGMVWFATGNHIHRYQPSGAKWAEIDVDRSSGAFVSSMAVGRNGDIWVGWSDGLLTQIRDTIIVQTIPTQFGTPHRIVDDGNGLLWIHTRTNIFTVSISPPWHSRLVPYEQEPGAPADVTPPMVLDREGNVWLGSWSSGLVKLSDRNLYRILLNKKNPLDELGACADSSGHIWIGTRGSILELCVDSTGKWQQYTHVLREASQRADCYVSLIDHVGRLWVAMNGRKKIQSYKISPRLGGASHLSAGVVLTRGKHFPDGALLTLFVDAQERMYIGVGSVAVVDLKLLTALGTIVTGVGRQGQAVRAIFQDRHGTIWMGGWNDGISLFDPGPPLPTFLRKYTVEDGLPDNSIRSFHEDREGIIWVGTRYGGIARLVGKKFETVSMRDGLMSNTIWRIVEDEHDQLYMRTDVGVERIDRRTMKPISQKAELLDQQVTSLGVVQGRFLWYTTPTDLAVYEYPLASENTMPPPIYISSFQANDKVVDVGASIALPFDENNCTIKYDGLSYKDEKAIRYQYRLLGAANEWAPPTAQRAITFATLKPGAYVFEVLAINADGVRSTVPASLSFIIVPPYWQRWWFFLLGALVSLALLWMFDRYRVGRILEMERLRMRIASDLHDDVGTNLSSIVIASQIMQRESSLSDREQSQLAEIRQVATNTQEMMRDIVWMLNPKNDSMDEFLLKMKEVAARLLPDIHYTFLTPGEKLLDKVSIEFKRNIFLIFKESLNNIARHASATEVAIEVKQGHGMFTMEIQDNGRGFPINKTVSGSGLANLRRRAGLIGGKLDITSNEGKGTTITLTVKNHANA